MARRWTAAAILVAILALVATMNGGGYQFGASDQAFYVPAIQRHLDPSLFPRDRVLIDSQDRLNLFTPILAALSRTTGLDLPSLFLAGYGVAMLAFFGAIVSLGRILFVSPWTVVALGAAMTLRHRIARTGANTFENYFHPRVLAFAVGLWALVYVLKGHRRGAVVLVTAAALIHPTTALWFVVWVGIALVLDSPPRLRRWQVAAAAVAAGVAAWMLWHGPLAGRIVRMDDAWVALLEAKDYIFPHQWTWWAWVFNFAYPVIVAVTYRTRRRVGVAVPHEGPVVAGAVALFALLVAAIPFAEARLAIVVQLQVSRVLWMLDLMATVYAVWWLAEGRSTPRNTWFPGTPQGTWFRRTGSAALAEPAVTHAVTQAGGPAAAGRRWRSPAAATCVVIALAAASRGTYVKWIEHPERPIVRVDLAEDAWRDAMRWLSKQPASAHVLADPGHAWRYGSSVRVAASRDVLLEESKDLSMAMYTREIAARVIERRHAIGDFAGLTPDRARELAEEYGLDYLVIDRPIDLPVAYRNDRFWIYQIAAPTK